MTKSSARWALFFANIGHTLTHLLMLLYPTVVLTLEARFGLTYGELMWLAVPGMVLYGVAALPAGWLADRWSAERMMVVFFAGSGVAAIVTGFAPNPLGIALGLGLIGFFGSIYHPVGTAWLVRNAENRGRMLGWNGIFGSIGIGAGPLAAATLTTLYGWRAAFVVPGVLCLMLGIALAVLVRGGPLSRRRAIASRISSPIAPMSDAPSFCCRSPCWPRASSFKPSATCCRSSSSNACPISRKAD
jgi:FSR family fosmidomycin resistance protein-like MFS transporter